MTTLTLSISIGMYPILKAKDITPQKPKPKDIDAIVQQTIALSAGEDKIWSLQEQREFLNETPLKDKILPEGAGIYLIPNYLNRVNIYLGASRGDNSKENYLGSINRLTLENYITKNTTQQTHSEER
mgnify:FL=1